MELAVTYKDILVVVDETSASQARVAAAATLAARHGAALTGVFLTSDFMNLIFVDGAGGYAPALDIDRLVSEHAAAVLSAAEAARMTFEAAAGDAAVRSDWLTISGDSDAELFAVSRRFDLTVIPPHVRACLGANRISAAALAMASGAPVLLLPEAAGEPTLGRRIVVAWKSTRESARALHDAWPMLSQADEVHAVVVSPHGDYGPDGALQRHMERHGLAAKMIVDLSRDADAGEVLRREALSLRADLLVMGVFGRTRLGELLLGGVSDTLLRDPPCALLLSH
jgi:nucleotide-binding universal stress UspA family protein